MTVNPAIPAFSLSVSSATVVVGEAVGFTVDTTVGSVSRYFVSPRLPFGLMFNTRTGALSGVARSVQLATTYTVTGVGLGGSSTQSFVLTVNPALPVLSLSRYSQTVVKGFAAGFTVKLTGGAATFAISPIPAGMSFNTSTGTLSGNPSVVQSETILTVTATNGSGSSTQSFMLTVTASFPVFTLSRSNQTVAQGSAAGFTVNSTGGPITSFSISPSAPAKMSFDTSTGELSGSPSLVKSVSIYTVTATNA